MPTSDYTPTHSDVARWLKDRITTGGGNRVEDFSEETVPTAEEVTAMIPDAMLIVAPQIGVDIPEGDLRDSARTLVAIETAINVEITFFSKQIGSSKLEWLEKNRDRLLKIVDTEADKARAAAGDDAADLGESAALPVSTFPQNAGGLVGYKNQF